ncbi:MAG: ABC transporter substrate-binding protein [Bifidobacteriaceae bacterium]|jgi:peptide/nickel transport system substrate-binding protein|nr:ABC transporter substrate-binding protein [Bifidobacteriaceae bacterium]
MTTSPYRRWAALAAALTVTFAMGACGSDEPTDSTSADQTTAGGTESETGAPAATTGGDLVVDRSADIFTFDPYNTQDDRSIFTEMEIYERLVKLGADGATIEPCLATEWTIAEDGLSAVFKLRDGVLFSDGSPMTAQDVAFSLTRAADQEGSWGFLFSPVKTVEATGDLEITITLSEPFAPLLPALATFAASIYPEAAVDNLGTTPIGTGAFMLGEWKKGASLTLVKNPNYWQEGLPTLDSVTFNVVGDDNARVLQLQSGEADVLDGLAPAQIAALEDAGMQIKTVEGTAVVWVILNEAKEPLQDKNVRLALAWAMDRETIASTVYSGLATPAKTLFPSSTLFYSGDQEPPGYDLDKAKEYLAASSVPDGFSFTVTVPSGEAQTLQTAQIWQNSLAQIGITLEIEQLEATTAQDEYNTEAFTARIAPWTNDTPDPDELAGVALDYEPQNGLHTSFRSDEARDLVLAGRSELDETARAEIYAQLQLIANQEMPFIPVVEVPRLYAAAPGVTGFQPNSQGMYGFIDVSVSK